MTRSPRSVLLGTGPRCARVAAGRLLLARPDALHHRAGRRVRSQAGAPKVVAAARDRPGALPRPPGDRALVGELPARRDGQRLVGRAAAARCSAGCWWRSCAQRLPGSTVYSESGAVSRADPMRPSSSTSSGSTRTRPARSCCSRRPPSSSTGRGAPRARTFRIVVPPPAPDTPGRGGGDQRRGRPARRRARRAAAARRVPRRAAWSQARAAAMRRHRAAAARMPGLRAVPDRAGAGARHQRATASRCGTMLRRTRADPLEPQPRAHRRRAGAAVVVMCTTTLMSVADRRHRARGRPVLGPARSWCARGMWPLAAGGRSSRRRWRRSASCSARSTC